MKTNRNEKSVVISAC